MKIEEKLVQHFLNGPIDKKEWSLGNGQCPVCLGHSPNQEPNRWWTDTVGHKKNCLLAKYMKKAGLKPEYEHENPDRRIGYYKSDGWVGFIRASDSPEERQKKLENDGVLF